MTERNQDELWRDFPKTAIEFEQRFATEKDCRAYWIEARWGGEPACAAFECADCGHRRAGQARSDGQP